MGAGAEQRYQEQGEGERFPVERMSSQPRCAMKLILILPGNGDCHALAVSEQHSCQSLSALPIPRKTRTKSRTVSCFCVSFRDRTYLKHSTIFPGISSVT